MAKTSKKTVIGIVGGIGSGKTTVAKLFAKLGCAVINADKLAHEVLDDLEVKQKLIDAFSEAIINSTGWIDRKKLSKTAFADPAKVQLLNSIVHPLVLERTQALIEQHNADPKVKAIILDMPLLIEVGWHKRCDKVIFIDCKNTVRAKRARMPRFFNEKQLKKRENFQISLDTKADIADNVIYNNFDLSVLVKQVTDIFTNIDNG